MWRREWFSLYFILLGAQLLKGAPLPKEQATEDDSQSSNSRKPKSLFFDFPVAAYRTNNEFEEAALDYDGLLMSSHQQVDDIDDPEDLSRSAPSRKRYQSGGNSFPNSPIYYIRLPATPYMFVPGLGYVSNPPTMNQLGAAALPPPPDPFINLPVNFMSNGKPTNIYQWPDPFVPNTNRPFQQQHQAQYQLQKYQQNGYSQFQTPSFQQNVIPQPVKKTPKPISSDSKVTHLKGPFAFNGRPTDIIVLRDSYNALYSDALTNFYP